MWRLSDLQAVEKNGHTVFSCFSCGGGSTMGYKLAGYDVIGNCEIDPAINAVYVRNHHPKFNYFMDIRDFRQTRDLPNDLYNLSILDGSPPCSAFSMAGDREDAWGKEKVFREGQTRQTLDDLFFEFIALADRLKPKIVIAENVKGILLGNAKGYVNAIAKAFKNAGYSIQAFMLNAAFMGVPQRRERVFFLARRNDLHLHGIKLSFNDAPIPFGTVRSERGVQLKSTSKYRTLIQYRQPGDKCIADINMRLYGKETGFNNIIIGDSDVAPTLTASGMQFRYHDGHRLSRDDFVAVSTFPEDYNFLNQDPQFVCGMSVPPYMMRGIAEQVKLQWLDR